MILFTPVRSQPGTFPPFSLNFQFVRPRRYTFSPATFCCRSDCKFAPSQFKTCIERASSSKTRVVAHAFAQNFAHMHCYQRLIKLQRLRLLCRGGALLMKLHVARTLFRGCRAATGTPRLITCCLHVNSLINWAVTFKQLPLRLVLIELSNEYIVYAY